MPVKFLAIIGGLENSKTMLMNGGVPSSGSLKLSVTDVSDFSETIGLVGTPGGSVSVTSVES